MLQHLLHALTAHAPHLPEPAQAEPAETSETPMPLPVVVKRAQPSRLSYAPRSVCTSLKDLCEL